MRKSQVNNENQENYTLHCAANGHHARRHIYTIYGLISGLHKEIPLFTAQSQVCLYFFGRISSHACFPFTIISLENERFRQQNTRKKLKKKFLADFYPFKKNGKVVAEKESGQLLASIK